MDISSILSRSFNIVWRNKALWVLGFLVALGSGGGGSAVSYTHLTLPTSDLV